jgi:hypothetical protein
VRALRYCSFAAAGILIGSFGWEGRAAAEASGTVVAVVQSAEVDAQTGRKLLQPAASVFSGDRVVTGSIGEAQIQFRDNTKLVVGPNSSMVIDAFVFNGNDTARQISINILRGGFRFITGNSRKDAYSIVTPTATIGVRGTAFDFNVDPGNGTLRLVNLEGTTRICDREADPATGKRRCVETSSSCGLSVKAPNQDLKRVEAPLEISRDLQWYFRYVRDQKNLAPAFRLDVSSCGPLLAVPQPIVPNTGSRT